MARPGLPDYIPGMSLRHLAFLALPLALAACFQTSTEIIDEPIEGFPASLEITGALTAQAGQSTVLNAVVKDSAGQVIGDASVTWSSSDSTIIAVTGNAGIGTVTAHRIGTVILTATAGTAQDTVHFTSSLTPYTFLFADTAPEPDRQLIRDAVQNAHTFQLATLGRGLVDSTTIFGAYAVSGCANAGASAFAGGRTITVCLGNQGWKTHGPVIKQKILQHELFHIWQFAYWGSNMNASSAWIIEGSAELMGYQGIAAKGLLSFSTALGCQVKESTDFANRTPAGPPLPALSTVETRQAFQSTQGPLYTHSMLAMDNLTATGGLTTIRAYGDSLAAGKTWQASFEAAFGKSAATFYGGFPGYLSGLVVPTTYLCRI
jgi:hypothetical protein